MNDIWELIEERKPIPNGSELDKWNYNYENRHFFAKNISWAIPTKHAINNIKDFVDIDKEVLEIGAGLGTWSMLLSDVGLKMRPVDLIGYREKYTNFFEKDATQKSHVEEKTKEEISKLASEASQLFFCWPSYNETWCEKYLTNALKSGNLKKVVYIGEEGNGCTGTEYFMYMLMRYFTKEEKEMETWSCMHDKLMLFSRNTLKFNEYKFIGI